MGVTNSQPSKSVKLGNDTQPLTLHKLNSEGNTTSAPPTSAESSKENTGRKMCQHCHKKVVSRPRNLCFRCYYDMPTRDLYKPKVNGRTNRNRDDVPDDPTEEWLEKTIAEQRLCLPSWWSSEAYKSKYETKEKPWQRKHWRPPVIKVGFKVNRRINGVTYQLGT